MWDKYFVIKIRGRSEKAFIKIASLYWANADDIMIKKITRQQIIKIILILPYFKTSLRNI